MSAPTDWQIQVFHDGDCPLCEREINMLKRLDKKERIWFTDIAAPDFDASQWSTTWEDLMERIQGRLPDGEWVEGVEVFRHLYTAVGFGWIVALTRLPIVRQLLDLGYRFFAKNRLRFTGRCDDAGCALPREGNA